MPLTGGSAGRQAWMDRLTACATPHRFWGHGFPQQRGFPENPEFLDTLSGCALSSPPHGRETQKPLRVKRAFLTRRENAPGATNPVPLQHPVFKNCKNPTDAASGARLPAGDDRPHRTAPRPATAATRSPASGSPDTAGRGTRCGPPPAPADNRCWPTPTPPASARPTGEQCTGTPGHNWSETSPTASSRSPP